MSEDARVCHPTNTDPDLSPRRSKCTVYIPMIAARALKTQNKTTSQKISAMRKGLFPVRYKQLKLVWKESY